MPEVAKLLSIGRSPWFIPSVRCTETQLYISRLAKLQNMKTTQRIWLSYICKNGKMTHCVIVQCTSGVLRERWKDIFEPFHFPVDNRMLWYGDIMHIKEHWLKGMCLPIFLSITASNLKNYYGIHAVGHYDVRDNIAVTYDIHLCFKQKIWSIDLLR